MKSRFVKIMLSLLFVLIVGVSAGYHFVTYTPHGRIDMPMALILRMVNLFGDQKSPYDYTPQEFRKTMDDILLSTQRKQEPIKHVEDRELEWAKGAIPVRIYSPSSEKKLPVILYFHGGAWVSGSLATHDNHCRRLATISNAVVVAVDYSLAPEEKFPTPLEQGYFVLQWLVANAADMDIDINKIIVAGDSAGGTLAAGVCMMARDRNGPDIRYQILLYPVTDLSTFATESHKNFGEGYFLTSESIKWARELYLTDEKQATNPLVSPLLAEKLDDLPPALIVTAQFDPLSSEGRAFDEKLKAAGNYSRNLHVPGVLHGFVQSQSEKASNVLNIIAEICARL